MPVRYTSPLPRTRPTVRLPLLPDYRLPVQIAIASPPLTMSHCLAMPANRSIWTRYLGAASAAWVATAAVLLASGTGCSKRSAREKNPAPQSSAATVSSQRLGVTDELAKLIEVSKSKLSRAEKRARLKQALETFPDEHSKEREDLLVGAVARGALDPPEWTTITADYKGRRAQIQVTKDALTILGVRFDVTAEGAQRIADQLHAVLPTPRILQLVWEQADVRLDPCTLPADANMASTARMIQHSECVDERIGGRHGLVANEGKHWVLTNRIAGKQNLAANYGWFMKGRRPVQTVGTRHDTAHTDYSQIVRLVKPIINVDGRAIDIRHVGRSSELWGLVSDEGPLLVWRAARPGVAPTPNENPVQVASPPKPGDPKLVSVTLNAKGMPVGLDHLPKTTTALRRNTFMRRIQTSLRMRNDDIPNEAYWSAGAAACGGRDIFFELVNEVPVDLEELKKERGSIKNMLECGKALTPHIRAGVSLYEVEYDYDSAPSGLALLALADNSVRDKLLYPALSPSPSGVHRAYCNDDEGGPRSVCQDGARSRLLLAVNQGYLAAYAREVPSLLARLSRSEPPAPALAQLGEFFSAPTEADEVAVALGGLCSFATQVAALSLSPDETGRERLLDAINDNAQVCGTHAFGSLLNPGRRYVFLAKNEVGAKVIEAALKRRGFELRFESGVALPENKDRAAFDKALRSAASRAIKQAEIERDGARLSLTVSVKPSAAELQRLAPLLDARAALAKQAAQIVRGLAEGKPPSAAQLEPFAPASTSGE